MKQSTLTKVAAVAAFILTLLTMVAVFFTVRAGAAAEAAITQRQVSLDMINRVLLQNQDAKAALAEAAKAEQAILDRFYKK